MIIDVPEAGANVAKAIEDYEKHGPYIPGPVQGVNNDPELIKQLGEKLRQNRVWSSTCPLYCTI